jgi:predicted HTH domain antitoxin
MRTVTLQLPDNLGAGILPSPGDLAHQVRLLLAIDWFVRGLVSQGAAAEIAQMPRADFFLELGRRGIENVHYDADEIDREMKG